MYSVCVARQRFALFLPRNLVCRVLRSRTYKSCFVNLKLVFFIIDYNIDKMSHCDEDNDQEICADGLSDFSYDSDSESQDNEESDNDDIIPRSRVFTRRTISSNSETISNEEIDEWSSIDNPPVLEEFLGHPGIIDMANVPEFTVDTAKLFIGDNFFAYLVTESNRYYY